MIKILSIDSSTNASGYAVFIDGELNSYGLLDMKQIKNIEQRMKEMTQSIYKIIDAERPDIVVVELTSVSRNVQTQRHLTMLLGAIYGKCIDLDIFWCALRPSEWRSAISGERPSRRDELKKWSIEKVSELFGKDIDSDDISDAVLIGLAYINMFS